MQNLFPLFERNRILKKELLWSLRDYTFSHLQLEYQEYGPGLLQGCKIEVRGGELVVGPGVMKFRQFICLATEEECISYTPADQQQFLKMKIEIDKSSQDYTIYRMDMYLDTEEALNENEFELCRFHLKQGANLRDKYTGFFDMETKYDTIHLTCATWSSLGGQSLSPAITRCFAQGILDSENSQPEDRSFAYLCLSHAGAVPEGILRSYIGHKTGDKTNQMSSRDVYKQLSIILKEISRGGIKNNNKAKERHKIFMD